MRHGYWILSKVYSDSIRDDYIFLSLLIWLTLIWFLNVKSNMNLWAKPTWSWYVILLIILDLICSNFDKSIISIFMNDTGSVVCFSSKVFWFGNYHFSSTTLWHGLSRIGIISLFKYLTELTNRASYAWNFLWEKGFNYKYNFFNRYKAGYIVYFFLSKF